MEDVQATVDESQTTEEIQDEPTEAPIQEETTEPNPVTLPDEEIEKLVEQRLNKRIKRFTAEKYALKDENAQLRAKLNEGAAPKIPNPVDYTDQYGGLDYEKYSADMQKYDDDKWNYYQNLEKQKSIERTQKEIDEERFRHFKEKGDRISEEHPEFWEIANQNIYHKNLIPLVLESELGAEITLYLGKNRAELSRINDMEDIGQMADAVEELEKRFQKKSKIVSDAPEPITPVDDSKGTPITEPKTDDEWYEREEKRRLERIKQGY